MSKNHRIDDVHRPHESNPNEPDSMSHKNLLSGMRWLYEDEADYERAQKKMASEIYREEVKKLLNKKARAENTKKITDNLQGVPKKLFNPLKITFKKLLAYLLRRKKLLVGGSAVVVLVMGAFILSNRSSENSTSSGDILGTNQSNVPAYDALLPDNSVESTTSGQISYDDERQLVTYTDDIGDISATVSQQPLPEKFQEDPEGELAKFAKNVGASKTLEINDTTVYLSSPEQDMQWFAFIKNQVLVFITSGKKLDSQQLLDYIEVLE